MDSATVGWIAVVLLIAAGVAGQVVDDDAQERGAARLGRPVAGVGGRRARGRDRLARADQLGRHVEERLDACVLVGRAAQNGDEILRDGCLANDGLELFGRDVVFEAVVSGVGALVAAAGEDDHQTRVSYPPLIPKVEAAPGAWTPTSEVAEAVAKHKGKKKSN